MTRFYAAYQKFLRMTEDDDYQLIFKLAAGELLILDNLRMLHGRLAYASAQGQRFVQGCFAERDSFWSRLAVLERRQAQPELELPGLQR